MSRLSLIGALGGFLFEDRAEAREWPSGPPDPSHREPMTLAVTSAASPGHALPLAAGAGLAAAQAGSSVLVCDLTGGRRRGPTLLASPAARELESVLRGHESDRAEAHVSAAARGHLCFAWLGDDSADEWRSLANGPARPNLIAVALPSSRWRECLESGPALAIVCAELPDQRSVAAIAVREARERGVPAKVLPPLGPVATRRVLAGVEPSSRSTGRLERIASRLAAQAGQATVLGIGAAVAILVAALAFAAVSAAVTGKGRAQRAADLAAISAARSMRDDFERLFEPASVHGRPNPAHLEHGEYLARARDAAARAARLNEAAPRRIRVSFPDRESMAPTRVRVDLRASVGLPGGGRHRFEVHAEAEIEPSTGTLAPEGEVATATGGGYSGPLVSRDGERIRPDVGPAFDRMATAAARAGLDLVVSSGFRSDAEQARLYARNPDPRWVAPPGRSLHRCATELDLGPPGAYGWLARNAGRFGFRRRYAWEAWHYGYVAGPAPCSRTAGALPMGGEAPDGRRSASGSLPAFVPERFRRAIVAAGRRHGVPPALLAAQLMVESNFNPHAVSPVGARGIAQFMPGTARSYGLRDPFDAEAAIGAQARLMSDLLRRFRSPALALAAYNAGPGAVARHGGIPPYRETRAYVARVLALAGGAGASLSAPGPLVEVRLVD